MAPPSAYQCDRCPLPQADPGVELRAAWRVYLHVYAYPAGSVRHERRLAQVLAEAEPTGLADQLLDDLEAMHEEVERIRVARAERDRQRQARVKGR